MWGRKSTGSCLVEATPQPNYRIPGDIPRLAYKNVRWADEYGCSHWDREPVGAHDIQKAEVVSSELLNDKRHHAPVLDLDIPAYLIPSTTDGHSHLYIDHKMTWRQYKKLLKALARAGILEKGYVAASIRRKHSAVRVPWVKKPIKE